MVFVELNALTREINGMLASCPVFWSSSDTPLLSKHIGRNDFQQLHHQVTAFIESVRSAIRWSRESHIGPTTQGSVVDSKNAVNVAGDHQQTGVEAGRMDQTALYVLGPQDHGEGADLASPNRDDAASSELTLCGPGAGATLAYRDVASASLETASPRVFYLHLRYIKALQETPCVIQKGALHCPWS